jgi:lysozyme
MKKDYKKYIIIGAVLLLLFMKTNTSQAETIIKQFEGKKLKAYKDSANIYTIGYGSTYNIDQKRPVQANDVIDEETALRWLKIAIQDKVKAIKEIVKVPINQNQLDSLTSLSYNIGLGNFKNSTLVKLLNAGESKQKVSEQFLRWNKAKVNGKLVELNGLTNRRKLEQELFLK